MHALNYRSLSRYPILAVALSMVGFIMIKTGRDAVFFERGGLRQLPEAYLWIALASIPAAMLHLGLLDKWGARKTRTRSFYAAALIFLLFAPFAEPGNRMAMLMLFVSVPIVFSAVFAGAWLLAADLLEGADSNILRRTYARIGAASMLGGIIGGLLCKVGNEILGPGGFIAGGSALLLATGGLVAFAHRKNPAQNYRSIVNAQPADEENSGLAATQAILVRQPYTRTLIGISVLATTAALYIDFQFYAGASISGNTNVQFFANFYIMLNLAALVVQTFLAPKLQEKLGITGVLLLVPSILLGGTGLFSLWTVYQGRTIMRVLEGGLKASIYRSIWEQTYLPISSKYRDIAKTVVDGTVQRLAEGLGALALFLWFAKSNQPVEELNYNWISGVIVLSVSVWIALTKRLGRLGCSDISPTEPFIRLPDG